MSSSGSEDQNETLRSKFVSVVGPVCAGGDETNLLTVLNSLTNFCYQEGLFVTRLENATSNTVEPSGGDGKALDFTCWLLSELITINSSAKVCKTNVSLQVTIMQLLATRNHIAFATVVAEYIQIGLDGQDTLFEGKSVSHQCFQSVANNSDAHPRPNCISFVDDPQLDNILTNIIKVIGNLGDYIKQYCFQDTLSQAWLLICNCLEAGDMNLKASSLVALSSFIDVCGLPREMMRLDYLIECIEEAFVLSTSRTEANQIETDSPENNETRIEDEDNPSYEVALAGVLQVLKEHLPTLIRLYQEEITMKLAKGLKVPGVIERMPGQLRKAVFESCCVLMECSDNSQPFKGSVTSLELCFNQHLMIPEVAGIVLKRLVKSELLENLPTESTQIQNTSSFNSRKRKYSESEDSGSMIMVECVSKWWKLALQNVSSSMKEWSERSSSSTLPLSQVAAACHIIATAAKVSAELPRKITLQYLPQAWLQSITDLIIKILLTVDDLYVGISLMELLRHLTWAAIVVDPTNGQTMKIKETWLALATLPWMGSEFNLLDLKPVPAKKYHNWANKIKWISNCRVMSVSIATIAILDEKVAPRWRCHVVRAVISEHEPVVMLEMAQWFPVMVHQLGRAGGQHLVAEVIGGILHSPDVGVMVAGASSLKRVLCAILNQTSINISEFEEETGVSSEVLLCKICDSKETVTLQDEQKVDPTLVSRFLALLSRSECSVVVAVVESLQAVICHAKLTPHMLNQILSLLKCQDKNIVTAIAKQLPNLVIPSKRGFTADQDARVGTPSKEGEIILSYLDNLLATNHPTESESTTVLLAILEALHYLVKYPVSGLVGRMLLLLLRCQASSDRMVTAKSHLGIHALADSLGLTLVDLYTRHRQSLAQVLVEIMKPGDVGVMLNHVSEIFKWTSSGSSSKKTKSKLGSFITSQMRYLLPPLVVRASQELKPGLLQELAACMALRLRDILIDHFQFILPYLVFHLSEEEQKSVLAFIADTTDIAIHNIRRCSVQNQVNELVLGLHDHRSAVLREFCQMREVEQNEPVSKRESRLKSDRDGSRGASLQEIAEYLSPRLLGILGFLDSKLVSSSTMYKEKRSALWSLSDLILVMGKQHISSVSHKVLASLKTSLKLKDEEFYDIGCHAWTNFLYNLDESTLLGLLEEIVIVIVPLVDVRPLEMAPVLNDILVETPSVKPLLANFPLFKDHEALTKINQIILEHQSVWLSGKTTQEVVDALSSISRGLNHESIDVRLHALTLLRKTLRNNQQSVHHLTTDSDNVHPVVADLFSNLLGQCRESEEELQVSVAECLGLLGAIDPTRFYTQTCISEEMSKIHLHIDTETFILELVTELSRAFLAATDGNSQTCASYAMQEVTRVYGIRDKDAEGATEVGSIVWERLPYHLQEIIQPLLTSKYTVSSNITRASSFLPSPIYGSTHAKTFHQWLTNWTCSLIDLLKSERASEIFRSCKPIVRRDLTTAMYTLSPLLVYVLCESPEFHDKILAEVLAVMSYKQNEEKEEHSLSPEHQQLAVQTVFSTLDYVSKWTQKQRQRESAGKKMRVAFTPSPELRKVNDFLDLIPANLLAQTSLKCKAYSRALLHIEAYLKDNPDQLKDSLHFLQCIYVSLDEPDGVAGVAAIRRDDPSLEEQIIEYEATGRLQDALGCYERLCINQSSEDIYKGLLDCYLSLDQPHFVLNISSGLLSHKPELESTLVDYQVEAAWRLSQWQKLETFMENIPSHSSSSWGVGVGQVFLAVRSQNAVDYQNCLKKLRAQHVTPMSAASMEKWAYQRAYPYILRLHMLTELEELVSGVLQLKQPVSTPAIRLSSQEGDVRTDQSTQQQPLELNELIERWDKRLGLVQTSHRYLEPILNFRRTLLELAREMKGTSNPTLSEALKKEIERSWLHSAKVSRKAGYIQQGEWALLGAGCGRDVFIERAKWHWVKGEQHQAVTTIHRGIERFFSSAEIYKGDNSPNTREERRACGSAKLLLARYSEESATLEVSVNKQYYRDACEIFKQWEDGHFHLAMYYDRLLASFESKSKPADWINHIVQSFGKSLQFGCRHIYQSMPRMLALWLEFGTRVSEMESKEDKTRGNRKNSAVDSSREKLAHLNAGVGGLVDRLPHYVFLTALPQLISRICHSNAEVFVQLCKIISLMLSSYPQQAMWHMIAVSKSSYQIRVKRCLEIFESAKRRNSDLHKFIADCTKLADKFLELSNKPVEKGVPTISLNTLLRGLPRLLTDSNFSRIILPLQQQMTVTLPPSLETLVDHNPFPKNQVYLQNIEDKIEIMQSLQLPKKITLRGSDGKPYIMMCKPKDDLRKDCRLMEFNAFVNRCLKRDPESRKRDLHIRTYAVVPLNEECGLIEWIENLHGLRHIIFRILKELALYMTSSEIKQHMCKLEDPKSKKKDVFLNILKPRHPPVFGLWFLRTFPDSQAWLRARLAYCRTTAVISMVGYILGLGDRHGENILFDASCGDTVHVDFNCLFNKGETFDWPERVPFRLTHNMIDAMGPTGYEGIYRKSCEATLRVMRDKREALMSVLNPFIHDPLVEWSRGDNKAKMGGTGEINNEKAQMHVSNIEHRLSGQINSKSRGVNLPLSVAGQVNALIEEATNIDNLSQMYIGWAAYM